MLKSMTGFASKEKEFVAIGKVYVELRSVNHKFLEVVVHAPEGLLSLEDKIKKVIESRIKRGRVTCAVNIAAAKSPEVFINKPVIKRYLYKLREIKREFKIDDGITMNTLMQLPGVLTVEETRVSKSNLWPQVKLLLAGVLEDLVKTRLKEGRALFRHLKNRTEMLKLQLQFIKERFRQAIKQRLVRLTNQEERASFLKDADIAEEIERLAYHIKNLRSRLMKNTAVGKELDFICQEMQREANTLAAKSFDTLISAKVVLMKSQIEKIREQVQNIE